VRGKKNEGIIPCQFLVLKNILFSRNNTSNILGKPAETLFINCPLYGGAYVWTCLEGKSTEIHVAISPFIGEMPTCGSKGSKRRIVNCSSSFVTQTGISKRHSNQQCYKSCLTRMFYAKNQRCKTKSCGTP